MCRSTQNSNGVLSGLCTLVTRGRLGRLASWHLPGGPVGLPARWAATLNVEGESGMEEGREGSPRINYLQGAPSS